MKSRPSFYAVGANGKGLHLLLGHPAVNAAWSPDGVTIAFDDHRRIGLVESNGGGPRYIARGTHPSWSPDGKLIAFERGSSIWLLRLGDQNPRLLIRNGADPTWMQD